MFAYAQVLILPYSFQKIWPQLCGICHHSHVPPLWADQLSRVAFGLCRVYLDCAVYIDASSGHALLECSSCRPSSDLGFGPVSPQSCTQRRRAYHNETTASFAADVNRATLATRACLRKAVLDRTVHPTSAMNIIRNDTLQSDSKMYNLHAEKESYSSTVKHTLVNDMDDSYQ